MRFPEIVYQKSCGSQFREGFPEEVMLKELGEKHEGLKGGRNLPGRQSISDRAFHQCMVGQCGRGSVNTPEVKGSLYIEDGS